MEEPVYASLMQFREVAISLDGRRNFRSEHPDRTEKSFRIRYDPRSCGFIKLPGNFYFSYDRFSLVKLTSVANHQDFFQKNQGQSGLDTQKTVNIDGKPEENPTHSHMDALNLFRTISGSDAKDSLVEKCISIEAPSEWHNAVVYMDWCYEKLDGEYSIVVAVFQAKNLCNHSTLVPPTSTTAPTAPSASSTLSEKSTSCLTRIEWWKLKFRNPTFTSWENLESANDIVFEFFHESDIPICSSCLTTHCFHNADISSDHSIQPCNDNELDTHSPVPNPPHPPGHSDHMLSLADRFVNPYLHLRIISGPSLLLSLNGIVCLLHCGENYEESVFLKDVHLLSWEEDQDLLIMQKIQLETPLAQEAETSNPSSTTVGDRQSDILSNRKSLHSLTTTIPCIDTSPFRVGDLMYLDLSNYTLWESPLTLSSRAPPPVVFFCREPHSGTVILQTIDKQVNVINCEGAVSKKIGLQHYIRNICFNQYMYALLYNGIDVYCLVSFVDSNNISIFELESWEIIHSDKFQSNCFSTLHQFSTFGAQFLLLSNNQNAYKIILEAERDLSRVDKQESNALNGEDHLYSVARAMKSQQEELLQHISLLENLFLEKEKMIHSQSNLMSILLFDEDYRPSTDETMKEMSGLVVEGGNITIGKGFSSVNLSSNLPDQFQSSEIAFSSFSLFRKDYSIRSSCLTIELIIRFTNISDDERVVVLPYSSHNLRFSFHQEDVWQNTDLRVKDIRYIFNTQLPNDFGDDFVIDFLLGQKNTGNEKKLFRYLTFIQPSPLRKVLAFSQEGVLVGIPWKFGFVMEIPPRIGLPLLFECMDMLQMQRVPNREITHFLFKGNHFSSAGIEVSTKVFQDGFLIDVSSYEENSECIISLVHHLRTQMPKTTRFYPFGGSEEVLGILLKVCESLENESHVLGQSLQNPSINVGSLKNSYLDAQNTTDRELSNALEHKFLFTS